MSTESLDVPAVMKHALGPLSQEAAAGLLGVTQPTISYWTTGKRMPGLDDLARLCAISGVPIIDAIATGVRPPMDGLAHIVARTCAECHGSGVIEVIGAERCYLNPCASCAGHGGACPPFGTPRKDSDAWAAIADNALPAARAQESRSSGRVSGAETQERA